MSIESGELAMYIDNMPRNFKNVAELRQYLQDDIAMASKLQQDKNIVLNHLNIALIEADSITDKDLTNYYSNSRDFV